MTKKAFKGTQLPPSSESVHCFERASAFQTRISRSKFNLNSLSVLRYDLVEGCSRRAIIKIAVTGGNEGGGEGEKKGEICSRFARGHLNEPTITVDWPARCSRTPIISWCTFEKINDFGINYGEALWILPIRGIETFKVGWKSDCFLLFFFKAKIISKTPIFIGVTKCKNND